MLYTLWSGCCSFQQALKNPDLILVTAGTGLEASPSGTPQLSSQPSAHHLPGVSGLVGMGSPGLQQHLQPAAPQYGLPPGPVPLQSPSQLASHGYNLLSSPAQTQVSSSTMTAGTHGENASKAPFEEPETRTVSRASIDPICATSYQHTSAFCNGFLPLMHAVSHCLGGHQCNNPVIAIKISDLCLP